ncbi:hypothetical protein G647_05121 [Cladophialophora carrionii CBS 160.54]|uniref:PXMP2/4 family protein 3 n=1 Tax=Cladophialophora carrionii CBS 160.54 TaxID=1279043 RepID=V9D9E5_9EURO|nr:uncharacterized protein G647_05121 [Cladophialophora carrionii CBS 160.54]ETI23321.1 hypothetical protein G647_05121 [Cladophialophora carrionii CBS 160.54]
MDSHIVTTTLQAAALSAISNLAAQAIKAYREGTSFSVRLVPLAQFVIFTLISCPPNILWQEYLEYKFPGQTLAPSSSTDTIYEKRLDIPNTLRKLLFDQTLGAFVNTLAFVAAMAAFKGKPARAVQREVERDVLPLMINSWKVWPFVAIMNFTLVPVNRRVIVGAVVGLFWGIYLSMFAAVD